MLRSLLHDGHEQYDSDGFRLRGLGFSRLDGFSDVVFGFALTLLVVSLEVPKGFDELHALWAGFIPFAVSFLLLMLVWYGHYTFFRRFGTHDAGTMWLNGVLLFVVLFYVYPLKFLFLSAFDQVGVFNEPSRTVREVVVLFSAGFSAIYFLFAALYANGYRQRSSLELNPLEQMLTRHAIRRGGRRGGCRPGGDCARVPAAARSCQPCVPRISALTAFGEDDHRPLVGQEIAQDGGR